MKNNSFLQILCDKVFFICFLFCLLICFNLKIFSTVLKSDILLITFLFESFSLNGNLLINIKIIYIISLILSILIVSNFCYKFFFKFFFSKSDIFNNIIENIIEDISPISTYNNLVVCIGKSCDSNKTIYINEKGLYQNILITGTIGSGKTSSIMYPLTEQLLNHQNNNEYTKIGFLILDVKGNYYKQVINYANAFNRLNDIILIELNGKYKYNPLDKPNLKPIVLANRLKKILMLFSPNTTDSYWLDKSEQVISECIKLCRLYNDKYVTFIEIHKLISSREYLNQKFLILKDLFFSGKFNDNQIYDLSTSLDFFENEFWNLDSKVLSIIKSEITRITSVFVNDLDVLNTFCPSKEDLNFKGFTSVLRNGKIVILNMNIATYNNLSKIIATYLKLDFQGEVIARLSDVLTPSSRPVCFICDEFHEYVSISDSEFFAQSREAKCINIVTTQSYTSLLNTIKEPACVKVITQNLINKFWFRTDDTFTIEEAQKQIGKEDKQKISKSISENAKETNFNYLTNSFISQNSNISESISTYTQIDYKYDTKFFTQELQTFSCLCFISDGNKILPPCKVLLKPYFQDS